MPSEIDTSSYPKAPALPVQKGPLEQAHQWGALQQQQQAIESSNLTISAQKLKQINDQFNIMNDELSTLADPEANGGKGYTKEQAKERLLTRSKTFGFKPEVTNHMIQELDQAPDVKSFARNAIVRGLTTMERVNNLYGQRQPEINGQPNIQSPMLNSGAPRPVGAPIAPQLPTGTEQIDTRQTLPDGSPNPTYNQKIISGPQAPVVPPGTNSVPGGFPGQYQLPVQRVPTQSVKPPQQQSTLPVTPKSDTGITPESTPVKTVMDNRFVQPASPVVGMSPLFEEGKKALTEDQAMATQKLTAIKPALAALDLMKGLRSGPGTETWNKAVAFAKANNIIPIGANDPTAIYQEVNKYLNQYVQGAGTRSDADLAQRELSNPNVTQQINPALEKLTRSTIAQDRIQAARANAFEGGNKLEEYGKHRSTFPSKMDPRAFIIDKMDEDEKQKLLSDMLKKKNSTEGKRFWQSLEAAKRSGVFGSN